MKIKLINAIYILIRFILFIGMVYAALFNNIYLLIYVCVFMIITYISYSFITHLVCPVCGHLLDRPCNYCDNCGTRIRIFLKHSKCTNETINNI